MKFGNFEIASIFSVISTSLFGFVGGWDTILQALVVLMAIDYITGIMAGGSKRSLASTLMFRGLMKKALIILVIVLSVVADNLHGNGAGFFRELVIYFYIGMEMMSIIENLGTLGVPLPKALTQYLKKFQGEQEGGRKK